MKIKVLMIVSLCAILLTSSAKAEDKIGVDQIVEKANFTAYYQGADGRARVKMNIVDSQGRTRQREMTILRWDTPNPKHDENTPKNKE